VTSVAEIMPGWVSLHRLGASHASRSYS
jgi:hypothetical protein